MIEVKKVHIDKTKRAIVISDIHANLHLFKKLLTKINYTEQDYLFINGDLCEKGPNSLEVVSYVRRMSENSDKVFITKGNCDILCRYVDQGADWIIQYMNRQKHSILNEMLLKHHKSLDDFENLTELSHYFHHYFHKEIAWLESHPIAYETEEFILVHAGIEDVQDWQLTEEDFALFTDSFYEKEHQAKKNVIVGHWPVVNYRSEQVSSNNPLIDLNKRIIALDGGNQIKKDGQLNALLIENNILSFEYVDDLPHEMLVKKEYRDPTNRIGTVTYPNYDMEPIKVENHFTLCENSKLGIQQWVKNEYLYEYEGQFRCRDDLSTTFLSVSRNEHVKVIDKECSGYALIKRENGEVGWIPKELLF